MVAAGAGPFLRSLLRRNWASTLIAAAAALCGVAFFSLAIRLDNPFWARWREVDIGDTAVAAQRWLGPPDDRWVAETLAPSVQKQLESDLGSADSWWLYSRYDENGKPSYYLLALRNQAVAAKHTEPVRSPSP